MTSFEAQLSTPTTIIVFWDIPGNVIINSYTITVTRLCDNVHLDSISVNGNFTILSITTVLSSGQEYSIGVAPVNSFGRGGKTIDNVIVPEKGNITSQL